MGTEVVTEIVWRVRQLVHDSAGSRWTDQEFMHWINDGLREIVMLKPSANAVRVTLDLDPGTIQALPDGAVQLLRVTHNTGGAGVRIVDQDRLDAVDPSWRSENAQTTVVHYMYDKETPMEYQVYPPNTGSGSLEASVAMEPTKITAIGETNPLPDIYVPALVDYLIYRAYSKQSKYAGNSQRAAAAYQRFAQALGIKRTIEVESDPNTTNKAETQGVE